MSDAGSARSAFNMTWPVLVVALALWMLAPMAVAGAAVFAANHARRV